MKIIEITDKDFEKILPSCKRVEQQTEKETVFIAMCRLGVHCKYNGLNTSFGKPIFNEAKFAALCEKYNVIPICPEQLGGLPTPRDPCKVITVEDIMKGVIERRKDIPDSACKDYTKKYKAGAAEAIRLMGLFNSRIYYGVAQSPMCGKGYGVLAVLLENSGYEVRYW